MTYTQRAFLAQELTILTACLLAGPAQGKERSFFSLTASQNRLRVVHVILIIFNILVFFLLITFLSFFNLFLLVGV